MWRPLDELGERFGLRGDRCGSRGDAVEDERNGCWGLRIDGPRAVEGLESAREAGVIMTEQREQRMTVYDRVARLRVQVDAGRIGGITPWLKVAHAAEAFDMPVCPHFLM